VWLITLLRFLWRQTLATFPPFPANMWRITKWSAQATEYALYILLFFQPLSGLAHTLLRGRAFMLFAWTIPALVPRDLQLSEQIFELHSLGALAFAALVGMHAVAALGHHFIFRDDVLELMAPVLRRSSPRRDLREVVAARSSSAMAS
jgi:cytochrome b561